MILQRAGHDFRGRGGPLVDQHHDRLAVGQVARPGVAPVGLLEVAPARRDDLPLFEEGVRDGDRLAQQAAGVVAQIEDVAGQILAVDFLADLGDRRREVLGGLRVN